MKGGILEGDVLCVNNNRICLQVCKYATSNGVDYAEICIFDSMKQLSCCETEAPSQMPSIVQSHSPSMFQSEVPTSKPTSDTPNCGPPNISPGPTLQKEEPKMLIPSPATKSPISHPTSKPTKTPTKAPTPCPTEEKTRLPTSSDYLLYPSPEPADDQSKRIRGRSLLERMALD